MIWIFLPILLLLLPSQSEAAICASQTVGSVAGNFVSNAYSDPYGTPFTVNSDCDVTGITLYTGNDGTNATWEGRIYDSNSNTLVTGGASASITVTWNTCMYATSTITQGTYTLIPGNTYYVGMKYDAAGHIKQCMSTTGINRIKYYPAGGPWTDWVLQYPAFSVTGVQAGGGGPSSSATTTEDTARTFIHIYVMAGLAYVAGLWCTIYIWRQVQR